MNNLNILILLTISLTIVMLTDAFGGISTLTYVSILLPLVRGIAAIYVYMVHKSDEVYGVILSYDLYRILSKLLLTFVLIMFFFYICNGFLTLSTIASGEMMNYINDSLLLLRSNDFQQFQLGRPIELVSNTGGGGNPNPNPGPDPFNVGLLPRREIEEDSGLRSEVVTEVEPLSESQVLVAAEADLDVDTANNDIALVNNDVSESNRNSESFNDLVSDTNSINNKFREVVKLENNTGTSSAQSTRSSSTFDPSTAQTPRQATTTSQNRGPQLSINTRNPVVLSQSTLDTLTALRDNIENQ
jgi:hypothetical protein